MRCLAVVVACGFAAGGAAQAQAQAQEPPNEAQIREAELFAAKGVASFEAKAYVKAAEYFLRAYQLSREPTQLRNAAKAYEAGGETELAQKYWAQLVAMPQLSEEDRAEARSHLTRRPARAAPAPVHTPVQTPVETPRQEENGRSDLKLWVPLGAGAGGVAIGAVLLASSLSRRSDLNRRLADTDTRGLTTGISYEEAVDARSSITTLQVGAAIAAGIGIAVAAAGYAWWSSSEVSEDAAASAWLSSEGGGLAWEARW